MITVATKNELTVETDPIVIVKRNIVIGRHKVPVEKKFDFTNLDPKMHEVFLTYIIAYE